MKVTVFTQVYNAKPYLAQCVESVLNQTFSDFEYIIIDNGCTDGSSEIIREYAKKDARIQVFSFEKNRAEARWLDIIRKNGKGQYITDVDPDDWLELDYLERLIPLAESSGADITCTGSLFHYEGTGRTGKRALNTKLVFGEDQFAELYPLYHVFFRTYWAKLYRMDTFQKTTFPDYDKFGTLYGWDTLISFSILRQSKKVYMDDSILHHYRVYGQSATYRYDPRRFFSDTYHYRDAFDFLSGFGSVSASNQHFITDVYANALRDTAGMVADSAITKAEKLSELRRMAEDPVTQEVLSGSYIDDDIARSRTFLLLSALSAYCEEAEGDFRAVIEALAPKCAPAVSSDHVPLLRLKPELADALAADDPDKALPILLEMIRANEHSKKFDLCAMVSALSAEKPLLNGAADKKFLRRHGDIFLDVWREQYDEALDKMTGLLLDGEKADEIFLQLYLSLAAILDQAPAFVFGKVRLAQLHLRKGNRDACRAILDELGEMGVEDNEEIETLKSSLDE